jgi:hypothetical protein
MLQECFVIDPSKEEDRKILETLKDIYTTKRLDFSRPYEVLQAMTMLDDYELKPLVGLSIEEQLDRLLNAAYCIPAKQSKLLIDMKTLLARYKEWGPSILVDEDLQFLAEEDYDKPVPLPGQLWNDYRDVERALYAWTHLEERYLERMKDRVPRSKHALDIEFLFRGHAYLWRPVYEELLHDLRPGTSFEVRLLAADRVCGHEWFDSFTWPEIGPVKVIDPEHKPDYCYPEHLAAKQVRIYIYDKTDYHTRRHMTWHVQECAECSSKVKEALKKADEAYTKKLKQ